MPPTLQMIGRTRHAQPATVENVRVDHRRAQIGVPEQFLNGPDVRPALEQMGREGVPERVNVARFVMPLPRTAVVTARCTALSCK